MLLAFFPVLLGFLGVIQLALLMIGQLVVTHAATRGVRSAIVILDDHPKHYDDAPRGDLATGAIAKEGSFAELWGGWNDAYAALLGDAPPLGGSRLGAIRSAVYHPLAVLAPSSVNSDTLHEELAGPVIGQGEDRITLPELRLGIIALAYNRAASAITVHTDPDGPAVSEVGADDEITVRVAYLMKCGVPLVSTIMCESGTNLAKASLQIETSKRAKDMLAELVAVASPVMRDTMFVAGARYRLITAQATLPNQGANYHEENR